MQPRLRINLSDHLSAETCDFTYGCEGYDLPVLNVSIANRVIIINVYTDNDLFEIDIQLPSDQLYDIRFYNNTNKIKLSGNARFNYCCTNGGAIEIAANSDVTFNVLRLNKTDLISHGSFEVIRGAAIMADHVTINGRCKLNDTVIVARKIMRIHKSGYINGERNRIFAGSFFHSGTILAINNTIAVKKILYLARHSSIISVDTLALQGQVIDYLGEIICMGKFESYASILHRFDRESHTCSHAEAMVTGRSLLLDGNHEYVKFIMQASESLDCGLNTTIKSDKNQLSTFMGRNTHCRGKMAGLIAILGDVVVNDATMIDGTFKLIANVAAINTEIAKVKAHDFSIESERVFAEGVIEVEGKCEFISQTSTYLSENLNVRADSITSTGQGRACIAAAAHATESFVSHHNGVVVVHKKADISAGDKIEHMGERVTVAGKADSKHIKVIAKTYNEITKEFKASSSAEIVVHAEQAYHVAATLTTDDIHLSGKAGCVDADARIVSNKTVYSGGSATIAGSVTTEILHLSQEQGGFDVAKGGCVNYKKEMQGSAQSVYVAGQLIGSGKSPSAVKTVSFITETASHLDITSPLYINSTTVSLSGEASHKKTVMTAEDAHIKVRLKKGELIVAGQGDNANLRIGANASLENEKLAVCKVKQLTISANIACNEIYVDAADTVILPTGSLGAVDSTINAKMKSLVQLGDINGQSANLQIERYYIQNGLHQSANTNVHTLKVSAPLYLNMLGRRYAHSATINILIPLDSGILQGNFIITNSLLVPPIPLLIIPNFFNLLKELRRVWSNGITNIDASYLQVASQTILLFLRLTHPVAASVASVGMNSYFLSMNFKQLSQHKILRGEALTNAEWLDLLVLMKNMIMSMYCIVSEANASYEAVDKALADQFHDMKDYLTHHFLLDIKDIEARAINFSKHLYYDGRDAFQSLFRDHPHPSGQSRQVLRDGRVFTETPYRDNDIGNAVLDHPGDKVMLDGNGRSVLLHDNTTDISMTQQCVNYLSHEWGEFQDWVHITRSDILEGISHIDRTTVCNAYQRAMPLIALFAPSVYSDSLFSLPFLRPIFTGIASQRSLWAAPFFSNTFGLSENTQAYWLYDYNNPYVINASYRGHYVYVNDDFYVPIFSVSANTFEQGKSAHVRCYMQTQDIPNMKKYRVHGVVNNYIYDQVDDENAFLQLNNQWRDYRDSDANFEANYITKHKLVLDQSFVAPWKTSYTASEILIPANVTRGSKKQLVLCTTNGSIIQRGYLVGSKIVEDSAGSIQQQGGGLCAGELYQHARNGISQSLTHVMANIGYQLTDHGDIANDRSQIHFNRFGYVDAVRGVVDQYQGSIRGGDGAPCSQVGLVVHGGQGVRNEMGAIGADAKSIIIGDHFIRGVARQHDGQIDRPEFYSNHSSVALISRYGTLDALCGHYRGKEGIYFDLRDAPHFRGMNLHQKHHHFMKMLGILPVSYASSSTDEQVSQLFSTRGVISFRVKYHDLIIPDSSLIAQQLITDVWSGRCYFPQTPIDHHDRTVSFTFGGNVAFIHFDYDGNARITAVLPLVDSLQSVNKKNKPISNLLSLLNAFDEAAALCHGYTPTIGVHAGIKVENKHYQTPNHTVINVALWCDYSLGIHIGDVQGHIGKLVMYCGNEFNVSGAYYHYSSHTQQLSAGLSYNLLTSQPGVSGSVSASSQQGGYYHSAGLTVGQAVFHQPTTVVTDQANVTRMQTTGVVTQTNMMHHANDASMHGISLGVSARGIESIGVGGNNNNMSVRRPDNLIALGQQHTFFSNRRSHAGIYEVPNNRRASALDNTDTYRQYVALDEDEHHHHLHPHLPILKEWKHLAKYLTDISHPYFKKSLIVYRGDARPPNEILREGFHAKGNNPGILRHLNPKGVTAPHDSLYISTSLNPDYAKSFPRDALQDGYAKSYLYKITAPESAFDIHAEVAKLNLPEREYLRYALMRHELEYVVPKHIPQHHILGHYEVTSFYYKQKLLDITMSEFIHNPVTQPSWFKTIFTSENMMHAGGYLGWALAIVAEGFELPSVYDKAVKAHSFHLMGEHISGVYFGFPLSCVAGTRAMMYTALTLEATGTCAMATVLWPLTVGTIASTGAYLVAKPVGELAYGMIYETRKTCHDIKQSTFKFFREMAERQPYANPLMYPPSF